MGYNFHCMNFSISNIKVNGRKERSKISLFKVYCRSQMAAALSSAV
jgi:hypothetical protein